MAIKQQRLNCGILFKNNQKETSNHPDWTGLLDVGGVEHFINLWVKRGQKETFFSVSVRPKNINETKQAAPREPFHSDEIGF